MFLLKGRLLSLYVLSSHSLTKLIHIRLRALALWSKAVGCDAQSIAHMQLLKFESALRQYSARVSKLGAQRMKNGISNRYAM